MRTQKRLFKQTSKRRLTSKSRKPKRRLTSKSRKPAKKSKRRFRMDEEAIGPAKSELDIYREIDKLNKKLELCEHMREMDKRKLFASLRIEACLREIKFITELFPNMNTHFIQAEKHLRIMDNYINVLYDKNHLGMHQYVHSLVDDIMDKINSFTRHLEDIHKHDVIKNPSKLQFINKFNVSMEKTEKKLGIERFLSDYYKNKLERNV